MIEPPQQRWLLARLEMAQSETHRHLHVIERQIAGRAKRLTITDRAKRRQHIRDASSWTRADGRLFQQHVAELTLARRSEIDALTRMLEWQELAIVALRSRHSNTAAGRRHVDQAPATKAKRRAWKRSAGHGEPIPVRGRAQTLGRQSLGCAAV